MSKELIATIESCLSRMTEINSQLGMTDCDVDSNCELWMETYNRYKSAVVALEESKLIKHKSSGDFCNIRAVGIHF